jgi:hypothetical protein
VAESDLGRQVAAAVQTALAPVAGYLALITQANPRGSADALLRRPDVDAILIGALDEARSAAEEVVQAAWYSGSGLTSGGVMLERLLADIDRIFSRLAHLHGLVRHAHASVPPAQFEPGITRPGDNPSARAAEQRAAAVRDAILSWTREASLRARMTVSTAEGAARTAAALAEAEAARLSGEPVRKRWRAHAESTSCCFWCRRLDGVTIGSRESFAPYLGGPVARLSRRPGSAVIYARPPRLYHGDLQGPVLHPFCRCWLEITRSLAGAVPSDRGQEAGVQRSPAPQAHAGLLAASDVRAMPEDRYRAQLEFLRAATHELDQALKRLAEGR